MIIFSAISNQIDDERLMAICLGINDDIQQTFTRYESFKKQNKPKLFVSSFLGEYASCNMISNLENQDEKIIVNNQVVSGSNNPNNQQSVDLLGLSDDHNKQSTNKTTSNDNKNYVKDLNDLFS